MNTVFRTLQHYISLQLSNAASAFGSLQTFRLTRLCLIPAPLYRSADTAEYGVSANCYSVL